MFRPGGEPNALAVHNAKTNRMHKSNSLDAKEREVTFLRREVERVTAERDALQLAGKGDKAYIRRLEHKMTVSGEMSTAERCAQLRTRVSKLKEELSSAKEDAETYKKELDASTRDKASLSHALELRASDLSSEAGEDVPSRLLYAVAKGREESVSLAVQLSEKSNALERAIDQIKQLQQQLSDASVDVKNAVEDSAAAHAQALDADARAASARRDAERVVEQAHAESARAAAVADEALADAEAVGAELRRERDRGETLRRAVDAAEEATTLDLERMRHEMQLATEATEREAREATEEAQDRCRVAEGRVQGLELELLSLKKRLDSESDRCASDLEQNLQTIHDLQVQLCSTKEHATALEEECGNLTAQIEAFAVVNARLQDATTSAQARVDAESAKTANLQAQIKTLESSTKVFKQSNQSKEQELKQRLKRALEELASTIAERDETKLALRETLAKCASAMATRERAVTAERAARATVDSLERGKRLLQETMAGQLEAVKSQLVRQREQNGALEQAVKRRDQDAENLRAMVQQRVGDAADGG